MKILYLANSRIPTEKAHGIQIIKTCESLVRQNKNIELELVVPTRENSEFKGVDPFVYYGVKNFFNLKKIFIFDPYWLIKLPQGTYTKFQVVFLLMSLFFYLLFKKNKKDYVFYTRDEFLLPIMQCFSQRVFWEAHNLPKNKKYYLKYWRHCVGIVAITQGLKDDLVKMGIEADKISVVPDGVDLEKFEIKETKPASLAGRDESRKKLNLPQDKKIIMYTGHLYDWKGVQTLAEAINFLTQQELVVLVGGQPYDLNRFKAKNEKLIKSGKLLVLGSKPYSEIPFYLKAADVLVLPNSSRDDISEKYTSPLKMFEYLAAGKPIVASDLPSIREVLNENNAILVQPDDPEVLARGIKIALTGLELVDKITKQAQKDAHNYSWQKRGERLISFLTKTR